MNILTLTFDQKRPRYGLVIALIIGFFIAGALGSAVDEIWFREDDIGTIVNGLVYSKQDFVHVMSIDDRNCICPANYYRSKPNLFSGFLRPLQHFLFSLLYPIIGLNAYAYFIVHVGLHALNGMLFFWLCSLFLPIGYAVLASLMFAFYPDVTWLTWAATMQNSLCTLLLLVTGLIYYRYLTSQQYRYALLGGLLFFLSLLARENGLLIPFWAGLTVFVLNQHQQKFFNDRVREALWVTMPLFIAFFAYWGLRLWAFGFSSLGRTVNNLLLRFPLLANFFVDKILAPVAQPLGATVQIAGSAPVAATLPSVIGAPWWQTPLQAVLFMKGRFFTWMASLTMLDPAQTVICWVMVGIALLVGYFLVVAYKGNRRLMWLLLAGMACSAWPGVVAYPCPRYLNTIYPFVVLLIVVGLYQLFKQGHRTVVGLLVAVLAIGLTGKGLLHNRAAIYQAGMQQAASKKPFDDFFAQNPIPVGTQTVLVLGAPFLSDIQSIFQYYTNNLKLRVAHEPFATLAQEGVFGCKRPYRLSGVRSELVPEPHGFRLISHDPLHCAWWMEFSDHPLRWDPADRAYSWGKTRYEVGIWYPCSIGRFFIHKRHDERFITDISFEVDPEWFKPHSIVVSWDTEAESYKKLYSF